MKSFRVYRVFSWRESSSELSRKNYLFSVVVSDEGADYVVNPFASPDETLEGLRNRLRNIVKLYEKTEEPLESVEDWSQAATYNLGSYNKFSLVLEVDEEAEPLANFEKIRAREEGQINDWIKFDTPPMDS